MIKLCRVDHRLLHGQVAFSWTNAVQADCILVASDEVVNDEMWKTTLKLGKPAGVKLVIKDIENSAIKSINLGGAKKQDGYRQISKAIFVGPQDEEDIKAMLDKGVEVEIRQLASESSVPVESVL